MISFQKEPLEQCWDELQPLWHLHWLEFGIHHDKIPLAPDREKYSSAEKAGLFHMMTARDQGELIGYEMCFVDKSLHYSTIKEGMPDIHFVHPKYKQRAFIVGQLIDAADEMQKGLGAYRVYLTEKAHRNAQPLLERKGYELVERIYAKLLE